MKEWKRATISAVKRGKSPKEIAFEFGISYGAVRSRLSVLFCDLGIFKLTELIEMEWEEIESRMRKNDIRSFQILPDSMTPKIDRHIDGKISYSEKKVIELMVRGYKQLEIAEKLGISIKTVKFHCTRAYRKLGVRDRSSLMVKCFVEKEEEGKEI